MVAGPELALLAAEDPAAGLAGRTPGPARSGQAAGRRGALPKLAAPMDPASHPAQSA